MDNNQNNFNNDFNNNYNQGNFNNGYNNNGYDNGGNNGDFGNDGYNVVYTNPDKPDVLKTVIAILFIVVLALIVFFLVRSCQSNNSGDSGSISADIDGVIYMGENGEVKLKSGSRDISYELEMTDDDIADVDDSDISGSRAKTKIKPKRAGRTVLSIIPTRGNKKLQEITQPIVICPTFNEKALVTSKNINIRRGSNLILTFNLGEEGECYSHLTYKPADKSIISVDESGVITGLKAGKTTLTVSNGVDSIKLNVTVTTTGSTTQSVSNPKGTSSASIPKATSVTMTSNNKTSKYYAKDGDTITVTMTFNKKLDGKPIVTINGKAATVAKGSNKFIASSRVSGDKNGAVSLVISNYKSNGIYGNKITKAKNNVVVDNTKPSCKMEADGAYLVVSGKDNTGVLGYSINQTPESSSSYGKKNSKLATAAGDWYGHVKDKAGNVSHCKANVSAADIDDAGIKQVPVDAVKISASSKSVLVGDTITLQALVYPRNATNRAVTWNSSNIAIASVNESGIVTGISSGQVTITMTSKENSSYKHSILVTVTEPVSGENQGGEEQQPQQPEEQKPEEQNPEEQKPEEQQPEEQKPEENKDTTKPSCTVTGEKISGRSPDPYTFGNWTQHNVKITAKCTDTGSGMKSVKIATANGTTGGTSSVTATRSISSSKYSKSSVTITATDKVGNVYTKAVTVAIDKTDPYISSSGKLSSVSSEKGKLTFKVTAMDSGSGVGKITYHWKKVATTGCAAYTGDPISHSFTSLPASSRGTISDSLTVKATSGCRYKYYVVISDVADNVYSYYQAHKNDSSGGYVTSVTVK